MSGPDGNEAVMRAILALVDARGPDRSICPSEAARALADGEAWRGRLAEVRRVAIRLAREGRITILRKGRPIAPDEVRGVIRLRVAVPDQSPEQDR